MTLKQQFDLPTWHRAMNVGPGSPNGQVEHRSHFDDHSTWRAIDADGFCWLQWPTEYSLFSRETGETHLLSELPAFVLHRLSKESYRFETLCNVTADACETANNDTWRQTVADVLWSLGDSELAECQQ